MFKLDDNLLRELGLGSLPPQEKNRMLQHIYETLEMRVGMRLAEGMSPQQLDDFERLMPVQTDTPEQRKQKEQDALKWLETNFPNYKQVVADELEKLKGEIKVAAPQIVAAAQQQAPPQPAAMPPQGQGQQPYGQQPYAQPQQAMQPGAYQQPPVQPSQAMPPAQPQYQPPAQFPPQQPPQPPADQSQQPPMAA